MAKTIINKTSTSAGNTPTTAECVVGELCVNTNDGAIFLGSDLDGAGHLARGATPNEVTQVGGHVLDEDDMDSNSAVKICSQQSIKAYVDSGALPVVDSDQTVSTYTGTTMTAKGAITIPSAGDWHIQAFFEWNTSSRYSRWGCKLNSSSFVSYGHPAGSGILALGGAQTTGTTRYYGWGYYRGGYSTVYAPETLQWVGTMAAAVVCTLYFAEYGSETLSVRNVHLIGRRVA